VGGGIIKIFARDLKVDGTISAQGQDGVAVEDARKQVSGGGGAGGSVYIKVGGTLSGSGLIHADGGKGNALIKSTEQVR